MAQAQTRLESWKPVPGYESLYEISDRGRVRSCPKGGHGKRRWPGQILKTFTNRSGHATVGLRRDNIRKTHYVHTLVLQAFVGPRPTGLEACHGNGTPADNRVSNLRWGTRASNRADSLRHGTHHHARKTHCIRGHPLTGDNLLPKPLAAKGWRVCVACRERGKIGA